MAITQVISTLPTAPDPVTMTRDQFSTAAAASVLAQKAMVPEINTWTAQVNAIVSGTAGDIASGINGAAAKTTPVDADLLTLTDSAASFVLKKLTWANLKTTLGVTFAALAGSASQNFAANALSSVSLTETTGAAWTAYTPTVTANTGTFGAPTINTARYRVLGKTLFIALDVTATVATGSPTAFRVSLPASYTCANSGISAATLNVLGAYEIGMAACNVGIAYLGFSRPAGAVYSGTCEVFLTGVIEIQ